MACLAKHRALPAGRIHRRNVLFHSPGEAAGGLYDFAHGVEPVSERNDQRDILSFTLRCRKESPKERIKRMFAAARGVEDAWLVETSYL